MAIVFVSKSWQRTRKNQGRPQGADRFWSRLSRDRNGSQWQAALQKQIATNWWQLFFLHLFCVPMTSGHRMGLMVLGKSLPSGRRVLSEKLKKDKNTFHIFLHNIWRVYHLATSEAMKILRPLQQNFIRLPSSCPESRPALPWQNVKKGWNVDTSSVAWCPWHPVGSATSPPPS